MDNLKFNQSIQKNTDQLIRHYQIMVGSKKEEVLDTILEKIEEKELTLKKQHRKISLVRLAGISAAASIAIIISICFFTATNTFTGNNSENLTCRLPDNSRVVLQNNSEIKYKKYFWNRKVKLQGVAYFEVEKGKKFQVITNLGKVEVLGTRFLVSEVNESMTVKCFEGKVKASIYKNSNILVAGTILSGTKEAVKKESFEEITELPDFAKFNKVYSKVSLAEITKDFETFFGTEIIIKNGLNRNFSGTIKTGKMESALAIVCESMQLNYRFIEKNRILITNQN